MRGTILKPYLSNMDIETFDSANSDQNNNVIPELPSILSESESVFKSESESESEEQLFKMNSLLFYGGIIFCILLIIIILFIIVAFSNNTSMYLL